MYTVKARLVIPYEEVVKRCHEKSNEEMVAGNVLLSLPTLARRTPQESRERFLPAL
jgi:hypothetical protein